MKKKRTTIQKEIRHLQNIESYLIAINSILITSLIGLILGIELSKIFY